jgi:hypothetical protein
VGGVCKFCGCTDMRPCFVRDVPGDQRGPGFLSPCAWLIEDVCTNPDCVLKAYLEARPHAENLMFALGLLEAA